MNKNYRPRVVIIGAGFGGLSAAKALRHAPFEVIVIDRHNYHLFQPLLYQVATAALSPSDIASPTRSILRYQKNATVMLGRVSHVDLERKQINVDETRIQFDHLIVATGAEQSYFGHDQWAACAPGLKSIDDATYLRARILLAFERAESEPSAIERRQLLNFVIVGGGPTGVELAGAVAELAKRAPVEGLPDDRPAICPYYSGGGWFAVAACFRSLVIGGGKAFARKSRGRGAARGRRYPL
jgi:NADH:ubiquinone reductase (H+-translocating)